MNRQYRLDRIYTQGHILCYSFGLVFWKKFSFVICVLHDYNGCQEALVTKHSIIHILFAYGWQVSCILNYYCTYCEMWWGLLC